MNEFLQQMGTVVIPQHKISPAECIETGVIDNIHTVDTLLKDHQIILVDGQHNTLGTDLRIIACVQNYYVVLQEGGYALYRRDGVLLADNIRSFYVFAAGWIMVAFDDFSSLYRSDATLAYAEADDVHVPDDGLSFMIKEKAGEWKLFKADGELVADKIVNFKFYSSAFYALQFADEPNVVIYDRDNDVQTKVNVSLSSIALHGGKMFTRQSLDGEFIYTSRGERLEPKCLAYRAFDNGLILAKTFNHGYLLMDKKFDTVLLHVNQVVYHPQFSSLMLVYGLYGCFIFDGCGKLLCKGEADTLRLAGHDCFLRKDVANNRWELVRSDMTVLDADCAFADVYPNGWMVLAKHRKDDATQAYFELRNAQNEVVVTDALLITYFPQSGAYLVNRQDGVFLYDAKGREVVSGADAVRVYVGLYVVERRNQPMEAGLLSNLVD